MTAPARLVVVGASLAGLRAVEAARDAGYRGEITMIGDEPRVAYDRTALSKAYLTEGAAPRVYRTADEVRDQLGVDLRLGERAAALDVDGRAVVLESGSRIGYDALVIATGAEPRRVPAFDAEPSAISLRTWEDADALRGRIVPGARVAIVGAGFIGAEIASSACTRGAQPVLLEAAEVPLVRAVGPVVGRALADLHGRHGVQLRTGVRVTGVADGGGVLLEGGEVVPAGVIVVGIGAVPVTGWLAGSPVALAPDGAVLADERLATSVPGVWAAGDVVSWPSATLRARTRLENWTSASDQGSRAGANAVSAEARPYDTVPYFWSDWYGHRIQFVGTADADEVVCPIGSLTGDRFVALFRAGDRIVGAATLNEPQKTMKYRRLIAQGASFDAASALFPTDPALQPAAAGDHHRK